MGYQYSINARVVLPLCTLKLRMKLNVHVPRPMAWYVYIHWMEPCKACHSYRMIYFRTSMVVLSEWIIRLPIVHTHLHLVNIWVKSVLMVVVVVVVVMVVIVIVVLVVVAVLDRLIIAVEEDILTAPEAVAALGLVKMFIVSYIFSLFRTRTHT